ncbi:hypothetical protein VPNG_08130 [Cytospora leucostoma]|uniref:Ubiquitin-like domain-containing protein n=1 Tax=Cytospora leucostoma TaxID=1230097 RepID=A0A423WIE6_9PEZI|nr:hypothetical protein VPNG_08130 [Cytospora leucostoma]
MDETKDSGGTTTLGDAATHTAAEEATANASAEEVSILGHEAQINLRGNEQSLALISVQHDATSQADIAEDIRGSTEGPAAEVPGFGPCETSLIVVNPSTAGTHQISPRDGDDLLPGAATIENQNSWVISTEVKSSSSPSSPVMKSGENSYTSSKHLVDESDTEETGDEKYRKKIDKGKGKEVPPRGLDEESAPPAEGQQSQSLANNVPWERVPERPPQKLPIRFTDCLGRNFVWPWIRARSWKGAKRLIESAFLYVEVLGPHVFAGHYDLTIQEMWSDPKTAAINPTLASYSPASPQESSSSVPPDTFVHGYEASSSASSSSVQAGHPPKYTQPSGEILARPG